jgi:hypothetical protein
MLTFLRHAPTSSSRPATASEHDPSFRSPGGASARRAGRGCPKAKLPTTPKLVQTASAPTLGVLRPASPDRVGLGLGATYSLAFSRPALPRRPGTSAPTTHVRDEVISRSFGASPSAVLVRAKATAQLNAMARTAAIPLSRPLHQQKSFVSTLREALHLEDQKRSAPKEETKRLRAVHLAPLAPDDAVAVLKLRDTLRAERRRAAARSNLAGRDARGAGLLAKMSGPKPIPPRPRPKMGEGGRHLAKLLAELL